MACGVALPNKGIELPFASGCRKVRRPGTKSGRARGRGIDAARQNSGNFGTPSHRKAAPQRQDTRVRLRPERRFFATVSARRTAPAAGVDTAFGNQPRSVARRGVTRLHAVVSRLTERGRLIDSKSRKRAKFQEVGDSHEPMEMGLSPLATAHPEPALGAAGAFGLRLRFVQTGSAHSATLSLPVLTRHTPCIRNRSPKSGPAVGPVGEERVS